LHPDEVNAYLTFRLELAGRTAKLFCPDAVETDMVQSVENAEHSALLFSKQKLLTPEEVAEAIVDLLDNYKLTLLLAPGRVTLTKLFVAFPALELMALRGMAWLGDRRRRRRIGEPG